MALLKSGWLWRQSSILKRWKLNWCDLWIDGSLVFYKTESRRDNVTIRYLNNRISLKSDCVNVQHGLECADVCAPECHPRENLLVVYLRDGSKVILCANSEDDALAWELTIMEAQRNPVCTYDPYNNTYHTVLVDSHNAVYLSPGAASGHGAQQICIHRERYDDGLGEQVALGMLTGMAAGAALHSILWMPFWFC